MTDDAHEFIQINATMQCIEFELNFEKIRRVRKREICVYQTSARPRASPPPRARKWARDGGSTLSRQKVSGWCMMRGTSFCLCRGVNVRSVWYCLLFTTYNFEFVDAMNIWSLNVNLSASSRPGHSCIDETVVQGSRIHRGESELEGVIVFVVNLCIFVWRRYRDTTPCTCTRTQGVMSLETFSRILRFEQNCISQVHADAFCRLQFVLCDNSDWRSNVCGMSHVETQQTRGMYV